MSLTTNSREPPRSSMLLEVDETEILLDTMAEPIWDPYVIPEAWTDPTFSLTVDGERRTDFDRASKSLIENMNRTEEKVRASPARDTSVEVA